MQPWNDPAFFTALLALIGALTAYLKSNTTEGRVNGHATEIAVNQTKLESATNGALDARIDAAVTRALNARLGPQQHISVAPAASPSPAPAPAGAPAPPAPTVP